MKRYCIKFECPYKSCFVHPKAAENDNEARFRNFEGNPNLCIKPKERNPLLVPTKMPVPTESEEQQSLFQWVEAHIYKYPELRAFYHIPNEGKRSRAEGAKLKREGLKEGVSDNCLPVRKGYYGSLYIELKKRRNGKVSPEQREWIELMRAVGNAAFICYGWEEARDRIVEYLEGRCERGITKNTGCNI